MPAKKKTYNRKVESFVLKQRKRQKEADKKILQWDDEEYKKEE